MASKKFTRALVTGASSGIGDAFARLLAADAVELVLVARREDALQALADDLPVKTAVLPADLTDPAQLQTVADRLAADPPIDLLINNAGFGASGQFLDLPFDRELAQVDIHIRAVMTLCRAAGLAMRARGHGGIINVSSMASFQPIPEGATYAACKAFETSFSEALNIELRDSGVHVTALCPGFVDTPLLENEGLRIPSALVMTAEHVARSGLEAVADNQATRVPGLAYKASATLMDTLPRQVVRRMMRLRSPFS